MSDLKKILKEEYDKKNSVNFLIEAIKSVLNEAQLGTAFERVIVDLAKNGYDNLQDRKEASKKPSTTKKNLLQLSVLALKQMGYNEDQINNGVDPDARVFSQSGITGDPKTDIIIDGKQISLKLPGNIQLGSGGTRITRQVFENALAEFKENLDLIEDVVERTAKDLAFKELNTQLNDLKGYLVASEGRFYPAENYQEALVLKFISRGFSEQEANDKAIALQQEDYVKLGKKWEDWNENIKPILNKKITNLVNTNRDYITIIIDEYLSGRKTFEEYPESIAHYLLSPESFYDISTPEKTRELIDENFLKILKTQARGKGRPNLTKEVAVRFEFNQKKYKVLKEAATVAAGCDISNTEAVKGSLNESLSKCAAPIDALETLANTVEVKIEDEPENNS